MGNVCDNCPSIANGPNEDSQADVDGDNYGDACDNCPADWNQSQSDGDGDQDGDACDNCPSVANPNQDNFDSDDYGDVCDNCVRAANNSQVDTDGDTSPPFPVCNTDTSSPTCGGDACDPDDDNDVVPDSTDTADLNPLECEDTENSGAGDGCDDCAIGSDGFGPNPDNLPAADGPDNDSDTLCDSGDPDDDNDGVLDGPDIAQLNPDPTAPSARTTSARWRTIRRPTTAPTPTPTGSVTPATTA
ncbi:MAG: hypothetical protein JRI68_21530 [Deltaproteobacteria bacterium]|nr:hypothetical protein [Deltaproteobacteria bacterium]